MPEPTDIDALIAEARNLYDQAEADGMSSVAAHAFLRLADALESTAENWREALKANALYEAELRQERERADEAERAANEAERTVIILAGDLARARERVDEWKSIYQAADVKWRQYEGQMQADLARAQERADSFKRQADHFALRGNIAEADLARAREVIEKVREWWYSDDAPKVGHKAYHAMKSILATYDQKEES